MAEDPKTPAKSSSAPADKQTPAEKAGVFNPYASDDPNVPDEYTELDPTKVVGTYAEQPDPNDERPAPQPNIPEGVKQAPQQDEPGAGAIGTGQTEQKK